MNAETTYWLKPFLMSGRNRLVITYDNDVSGIVMNEEGRILTFADEAEAREYAGARRIATVGTFDVELDLGRIEQWLFYPETETIDCDLFLDAWNFFTDVAASLHDCGFDDDKEWSNLAYDKLYFSSVPIKLNPDIERYVPKWDDEDVEILAEVLYDGFLTFAHSLDPHPSEWESDSAHSG
jgi:hypothetical protein